MKAIPVLLLVAFALGACGGGLPSHGQIGVKGTTVGLNAGTDPAQGGASVTLGYKNAMLGYNPNAATGGDEGEGPKQLIDGLHGNSKESRGMMFWTDAEAQGGVEDGARLSMGDGMAFGTAAILQACGMGNAASGSTFDCTEIFAMPDTATGP